MHSMILLTCCDNMGTGALPALLWKTRRPDNYHTWPYILLENNQKNEISMETVGIKLTGKASILYLVPVLYI